LKKSDRAQGERGNLFNYQTLAFHDSWGKFKT